MSVVDCDRWLCLRPVRLPLLSPPLGEGPTTRAAHPPPAVADMQRVPGGGPFRNMASRSHLASQRMNPLAPVLGIDDLRDQRLPAIVHLLQDLNRCVVRMLVPTKGCYGKIV